MTSLKEAELIVKKHQEELSKKKDELLEAWIDSKVGKTFVYRDNSYGCTSELKWDSFKIILKKIDNHSVLIEEWQLIDNKTQKFEIKRHVDYVYDWNIQEDRKQQFNGLQSCTKKEFDNNKNKILKLLQNTFVTDGLSKENEF